MVISEPLSLVDTPVESGTTSRVEVLADSEVVAPAMVNEGAVSLPLDAVFTEKINGE
jgi:hypothetical protein